MAGVQPVDELYDAITSYLSTFKQHSHETMKEYIKREGIWWGQLQESVALTDGKEKTSISLNHCMNNFEACCYFEDR